MGHQKKRKMLSRSCSRRADPEPRVLCQSGPDVRGQEGDGAGTSLVGLLPVAPWLFLLTYRQLGVLPNARYFQGVAAG